MQVAVAVISSEKSGIETMLTGLIETQTIAVVANGQIFKGSVVVEVPAFYSCRSH